MKRFRSLFAAIAIAATAFGQQAGNVVSIPITNITLPTPQNPTLGWHMVVPVSGAMDCMEPVVYAASIVVNCTQAVTVSTTAPSVLQFLGQEAANNALLLPKVTAQGSTVVFAAAGNPNGASPPIPTAPGVTFTECTQCASTNGDRLQIHFYYALNCPPLAGINFTSPGAAATVFGWELTPIHGLDGGAELGTSYGNFAGVQLSMTTTHAGVLVLGVTQDMPVTTLSPGWSVELPQLTDNNYNPSVINFTAAAPGVVSFTSSFPSTYSRPTISMIGVY